MKKLYVTLIAAILVCRFLSLVVMASPFERRRDQFQNTPGSLLMPFPYSIPGIGKGVFVVGYMGNVYGTSADVLAMGFTGDARGFAVSSDELFLIPGFLYITADEGSAAKFGQNVYSSRGMETEKEDFNIFVGEDFNFREYEAVITLFERRLELTRGVSANEGQFVAIKDFEGEHVQDLDNPIEVESAKTYCEIKLDITDDFNDPREGLILHSIEEHFTPQNDGDPEYKRLSQSATLYIPMFKESTFLFHYFRSKAIVIEEGNVDLESLKAERGFSDCDGDTECESAVLANAQNQLYANKNGTAKSLGGSDRLRAYPLNRYQSAHSELFGAEFRWNFKTGGEVDLFFLKDVIDSYQMALFWEQGSVAETEEELGDITRSSYGAGFRFVGQSGSVYRLDFASGDEGSEMIAFFEYPWTGFLD